MSLHELHPAPGSKKKRKRLGQGLGSGTGKTAGKGHKGQKARSGGGVRPGFEGGQMPLVRRIPKRGFNNIFRKEYAEVNLGMIQKFIDAGKIDVSKTLDGAALNAAGLARGGKDGIRLLAKGELTSKVNIVVAGASKAAVEAVEKAGGSVEQTAPKKEKAVKADA